MPGRLHVKQPALKNTRGFCTAPDHRAARHQLRSISAIDTAEHFSRPAGRAGIFCFIAAATAACARWCNLSIRLSAEAPTHSCPCRHIGRPSARPRGTSAAVDNGSKLSLVLRRQSRVRPPVPPKALTPSDEHARQATAIPLSNSLGLLRMLTWRPIRRLRHHAFLPAGH